jgi:hypothetical protein
MEMDARPKAEKTPNQRGQGRRQYWTWGIAFVLWCAILGLMVGRIVDNPWWIVGAVVWISLGAVAGRWMKQRGLDVWKKRRRTEVDARPDTRVDSPGPR